MPVGIYNKSSESRGLSKYQSSLRSDHPLVNYKYLTFSKFSSPFSPPPQMVESGKTTLSSQFVHLPDTPTNFHRPSTSRSTKLAKVLNLHPLSPPKRVNPVWLRQSRIYNICLFYPPSFIPISPFQLPQCQQIWSGFEIRALRHELLLNIKFY